MARKPRTVGLIGLGIIGSRAAAALRAAGFQVFVWNRAPRPAPNFLGSVAEVARSAQIIQLFVADGQAVMEVIEAMGDALTPDHILICSATIGPEATRKAADLAASKGARFLDAPFTGSKGAAEQRNLVYYVGGEESVFLRARPVLEATSKSIVPAGKIGDAAVLKLVTNMIAAASIQAMSEGLAIAEKAGIDPEFFVAALDQNACKSGTMDLKLPKMRMGDYSAHFSLKHMLKDVRLGTALAESLNVPVPAGNAALSALQEAVAQGWGELDFAALFKRYEPVMSAPEEMSGAQEPVNAPGLTEPLDSTPEPPQPPEPVEKLGFAGGAETDHTDSLDPADPVEPEVPDEVQETDVVPPHSGVWGRIVKFLSLK